MSEQQHQNFIAKVKKDSKLQGKIKAAKSTNEIVEIAKEEGHEVSHGRVSELTEQQLESISGSAGTCAFGINSLACTE